MTLSRCMFGLLIFLLAPVVVGQSDTVHSVHMIFSHHLDVGLDLPDKRVSECVGQNTVIVTRSHQ